MPTHPSDRKWRRLKQWLREEERKARVQRETAWAHAFWCVQAQMDAESRRARKGRKK